MNAAAVFRRQRLLSPAARLGPRSVPRSFERLRPVPYEPRVAHCGAPYGYARFIWYGPEALEAPWPAAGAKTRSGRKEASPPKNGRCVHFSSMPVLTHRATTMRNPREREREWERREKEHRGRQAVWWENTLHETHRPIYLNPTLVYYFSELNIQFIK